MSRVARNVAMTSDLPSRQKSQRLAHKNKASQQMQHFQQYRQRAKNITSVNELLPGLNDISDAIEALPVDLIKFFTLLKEIDAKCINTVPVINNHIESYIEKLHGTEPMEQRAQIKRLTHIRNNIHDVIPCLEEKMHVTLVAADVLNKHLFRIDNDYKLIINNNEIPESIRIGPLNHPAMILDASGPSDLANPNRLAQSARSESRREALAARKANREPDDDGTGDDRRKRKEPTPQGPAKKRLRKDGLAKANSPFEEYEPKKRVRPRKEDDDASASPPGRAGPRPQAGQLLEPTYCYCNQVSFGEMVGCDGDDCKREWFHLPCIGFKNPPKGKWYCDDCLVKMKKRGVRV